MMNNAEAARARAEASFKTSETDRRDDPGQAAERAVREKTERLREARLAKEAQERLGKEIRADRRRGALV